MVEITLENIRVLSDTEHPAFSQRESGIAHTPYIEEITFFSAVQQGDTKEVKRLLEGYLQSSIVVGHLSDNPINQLKYWGVCCITLGTRYAIQGGLPEMDAFNFSDKSIQKLDKLGSKEEILNFLGELVLDLTERIRLNAHKDCPSYIRRCLEYIDLHLHEKIRLEELAKLTNFSEDYLSRQFKKYVGKNIKAYIMEKKLEEARMMLCGECDEKMIAYYLGFCSQTYFITHFKKAYGITPHQYAIRRNIAEKESV